MGKRKNIVRDYIKGDKVSDLSKKYEMTREGIYGHLRTLPGWETTKTFLREERKDRKRKENLLRIRNLKEEGMGSVAIARKLQISYSIVREVLRGSKYDNSQRAKAKRDDKILEMYKEGMTQTEIGKEFGLTQARISNILQKFIQNYMIVLKEYIKEICII